MSNYVQERQANPNIDWVDEECLADVRTAFSVPAKFSTAAAGWKGAQYPHPGETPPSNVAVPIWFSYSGPDGHVALWYNGVIYSSSSKGLQKFSSIQALINWMGEDFKYLGWSEDINGERVVEPAPAPPVAAAVAPSDSLPSVGSKIQLIPTQTRTTWKVGTADQAGSIHVTDDTYIYEVRGYDSKYPGRIIINSASGGGNGVGLALYYLGGGIITGWKTA